MEKWAIVVWRDGQWWSVNHYLTPGGQETHCISECEMDLFSSQEAAYKQLVFLATRAVFRGISLESVNKWVVKKITIS